MGPFPPPKLITSRLSEQTKDLNRLAVFENNVEETKKGKNNMPLITPPYKTHDFCRQIHIASFLGFVIPGIRPVSSDAWSNKPVGEQFESMSRLVLANRCNNNHLKLNINTRERVKPFVSISCQTEAVWLRQTGRTTT